MAIVVAMAALVFAGDPALNQQLKVSENLWHKKVILLKNPPFILREPQDERGNS